MKCFLLSDNVDTQIGMRLAGIEGVIVYKPDEIIAALDTAVKDPDAELGQESQASYSVEK